jgi:hypothetical protein
MTFKIVSGNEASEQVVGTVWADAEPQAVALAASLFGASERAVRVRRTEDREIPMRVAAEPSYNSPFLS